VEITDKIREVMQWSGMSQKELAAITGIPYTTLNGYLCGRNQIPLRVLPNIAKGLGVSSTLLLNEEPLPADALELSQEERELVKQYRQLTRDQKEILVQNMALFIRQNRDERNCK
jgi:transcriptional regulator with XRE-family HTH domain